MKRARVCLCFFLFDLFYVLSNRRRSRSRIEEVYNNIKFIRFLQHHLTEIKLELAMRLRGMKFI